MKIKELLEHLIIATTKSPIWITPKLSKYLITGKKLSMPLKMTYGDFDVYRKDDYFGVFKNKKLYLFAEIEKYNDKIWTLSKLERNKNKQTNDMAYAFFHYLVLDLALPILSDKTMTPQGNKFYLTMIERNQSQFEIYDAFNDQTYPIENVGKLTITNPRVIIKSPEKDFGDYDIDENDRKIPRDPRVVTPIFRWFWLATTDGRLGKSHYLKEQIDRGNYPKECLLFGEQDYPFEIG